MTDVVKILLRLPRESQDPRIHQILNWYDQRPIGPNGRRSSIQDHVLQALSLGLSKMEYGIVAGVRPPSEHQGDVDSGESSTAIQKRASDQKTTSRNASKNTAMKKVAAKMKF